MKNKKGATGAKPYVVLYNSKIPFALNFDSFQVPTVQGLDWQIKMSKVSTRRIALASFLFSLASMALNIYLLCA